MIRQGFDHDAQACQEPLSPAARLAYHQAQSQPRLDELKQWLDQQRNEDVSQVWMLCEMNDLNAERLHTRSTRVEHLPHESVGSHPLPHTSWLHRGGAPWRGLCQRRSGAPRRADGGWAGRVQRRGTDCTQGRRTGRVQGGWTGRAQRGRAASAHGWRAGRASGGGDRRRQPHGCWSSLLHLHELDAWRPCHTHGGVGGSLPRPGARQEQGRDRYD